MEQQVEREGRKGNSGNDGNAFVFYGNDSTSAYNF